jgi:hypothetical protein
VTSWPECFAAADFGSHPLKYWPPLFFQAVVVQKQQPFNGFCEVILRGYPSLLASNYLFAAPFERRDAANAEHASDTA